MGDFTFQIQSTIKADKAIIWRHVTQMKNVNAELMPYVRMTYPNDRAELGGVDTPMGVVLLRSWILLFDVVPVDLHSLRFDRIVHGEGFYENSYTWTHRYWKHTRSLTEVGDGGVVVKDEVHFSPRLPLVGYLLLPVCRFVFRHRHEQLLKAFNSI